MKRIAAVCVGIALMTGGVITFSGTPARAQSVGAFADVPPDYWAYDAVDTLQKAGIIIGYPDGTYGGRQAMTRYQFATAIAQLLPLISPPVGTSKFAAKDDLAALQADIEARLTANQAAIDALTALVTEFQTELQQLGVDVAAIKMRLAILDQPQVKVTGELKLIGPAHVRSGAEPLDNDGYRASNFVNSSLFTSPNVYHDVLLTIMGRASESAQAVIKLDNGNYLPTPDSAISLEPPSNRNSTAAPDDFDIYRAYLDAPVALEPVGGAEAVVGRFGDQFTPFSVKALDPDSYADEPETDTGDITADGANIAANGGPYQPDSVSPGALNAGNAALQAGQGLAGGVSAIPVKAAVPPAEAVDTPAVSKHDKIAMNGADYNAGLTFGLTTDVDHAATEYGSSLFGNLRASRNDGAVKAELGYNFGPVNLRGGYEEIQTGFGAAGYVNKIGSLTHPNSANGYVANLTVPISNGFSFDADASILKEQANTGDEGSLGGKDKVNSYGVGIKDSISSAFNLDLGYEYVQYNLNNEQGLLANPNGRKPTEEFITFGIGHPLNKNSAIKFLYQVITYNDQNTGFEPEGNSRGGVAVTELSLKF